MHFSTFNIPGVGEGTIDDLVLFSEAGELADVERKWTAVKKYALLVDRSHAEALKGVRCFLAERTKVPPSDEDELDDICMASMEFSALSESNSVIVKSLMFLLLASFQEYGLKQVQRCVEPGNPPPPKKAVQWILKNLIGHGLLADVPEDYETHFNRFRDPVRNNLAHGDWSKMANELHALDLTRAFLSVAGFFVAMQPRLREMGRDV